MTELCIPAASTELSWNASSLEDWQRAAAHQPPGRMEKTFAMMCLRALSESERCTLAFLLPEDLELGICALQSRLSEEAQEQHESLAVQLKGADDDRTHLSGYGQSWHVQLEVWRATLEYLRDRNTGFSSNTTERCNQFTATILYHASYLRIYVDFTLINRLIEGLDQTNYPPVLLRRFEMQIQQWAKSRNARRALLHAAQILQLYAAEAPTFIALPLILNPATTTCLFRASLVVWAFSRSTLSCDLCTALSLQQDKLPSSPGCDLACELTATALLPAEVDQWLNDGGSVSVDGHLICACAMPMLVEKFKALTKSTAVGWNSVDTMVGILSNLQRRK